MIGGDETRLNYKRSSWSTIALFFLCLFIMRQLARARLSSLRRAKASLKPYWSHRSSLPRPKRFARRRHRPTPMAIDTLPLDAHCVIVSPEPMDIDQWEVNVALQPDEAAMLACVVAMGGEADVLPVHGGWSGTRVPSFPSPIPMVADQLHPSSSPSPTQLAPTNPTMEDGNILDRVPFAPSPTRMVAEQVFPSLPSPHFALPVPTMWRGVSPTPSSSSSATPSSEGSSRSGSADPDEERQQTLEVPAVELSDYESDDAEVAPEEPGEESEDDVSDQDNDGEPPAGVSNIFT
jgi:hypothetical protein